MNVIQTTETKSADPAAVPYVAARKAIRNKYVRHTRYQDVVTKIVERLDNNRIDPGGHKSLIVTGMPNAGKTTVVKALVARYPTVPDANKVVLPGGSEATCDHVPLVAIKCPMGANALTLLSLMLRELGDPFYDKRSKAKAETVLRSYIEAAGTIGVIVDEAQRPADRKGKIIQSAIATLFQDIHDWGVVVVLIGLGRAEALTWQDRQVGRRWSSPLRIDAYRWGMPNCASEDVPADRLAFQGLLLKLTKEVGTLWPDDIDVRRQDVAFRFYYASYGLVGYLKDVILAAIDVAKQRGARTIDWNILAEAFQREYGAEVERSIRQNPFVAGFETRLPPPPPDDVAVLYPVGPAVRSRSSDKHGRALELTDRLTK